MAENRESSRPKVERLITLPHLTEFQQGLERWMDGNMRELEQTPAANFPPDFGTYLSRLEAYCAQCIMHIMKEGDRMNPKLSQALKDAINDVHTQMIAGVPKRFEDEFGDIRRRKLAER